MNCPKCNENVAENATFCNSCGYKLSGDGQILSTNAVVSIQDKSSRLYNRVTYSLLTKILFFSTLLAIVGAIVGMFSIVEGGYAFAIPAILIGVTVIYRTIKMFVDVDMVSNEQLAQELRLLLTFFSYSLFLMVVAGIVVGVCSAFGSWKYVKVITLFTGVISTYGILSALSLSIVSVIFFATSLRK